MNKLFYNDKMFESLMNSIELVHDPKIMDPGLLEGWLEQNYVYDRYNTTRAVERYAINLAVPKIISNLETEFVQSAIDEKMNYLLRNQNEVREKSFERSVKLLNETKKIGKDMNNDKFRNFLEEVNHMDNLIYMKSNIIDNKISPNPFDSVDNSSAIAMVQIIEALKHVLTSTSITDPRFTAVREGASRMLYLFKDIDPEYTKLIGIEKLVESNLRMVVNSVSQVKEMYAELEAIMEGQCDYLLDYLVEQMWTIDKMGYVITIDTQNEALKESATTIDDMRLKTGHHALVERFDSLVEELFNNESDDMDLEKTIEMCTIAKNLVQYESTLEATSRIITKGTSAVTKSVGNASARAGGLGKADSAINQVRRTAKVVDDRVSGAVNDRIEAIINVGREAKREKLITGKTSFKLSRTLKNIIGLVGGKALAKAALGPIMGTFVTILGVLTKHTLSKKTSYREKKRILLELETELDIVKEKIEDSKGDNARDQKYQLMRIKNELEKEVMRIKHGLRYY